MKTLLLMILSVIFGFGFWYLIFWFITNEPNLFLWHWLTKILYLLFSMTSCQGIYEGLLKNED